MAGLRRITSSPLPVLFVEDQFPISVGFLLGPEAVHALRDRCVTKLQVTGGRKSGGLVRAQSPHFSRRQLAEQVFNLPTIQRGLSIIYRDSFPVQRQFSGSAPVGCVGSQSKRGKSHRPQYRQERSLHCSSSMVIFPCIPA